MGLTTSVITVGAQVAGQYQQYQAGKETEKAAKERRRAAERAKAREVRKQMRENRMRQAQVANAAAQTGVQDSSLELGTQNRLQSQLGQNLGTLEGEFSSQQRILSANENAAEAQQRAQLFGAVSQGASMFMPGGQFASAGNLFSSTPDPRANPNMNGQR